MSTVKKGDNLFHDDLDFTNASMEMLYNIVDRLDFTNGNEAEAVYQGLKNTVSNISFSDYLKRYIYQKAGLEGSWREISDNVYASILLNSFEDNAAPASFEPSTIKKSVMAKNWLKQFYVNRQVVLLLGFGLRMSEEDVDEFLTGALKETRLNPKDPFEVICWYCYKNKLLFPVFKRLYDTVMSGTADCDMLPEMNENTPEMRKTMYDIRTENDLLRYINSLQAVSGKLKTGVTAAKEFANLYNKICGASNLNSGIEIEKLLYDSIPRDDYGNLVPVKESNLSEVFTEKRLTRQRISQIKAGKTQINRYDLMTLNFLVYGRISTLLPKRRYIEFIDSTNAILKRCGMSEMYAANPYEWFLMICMLAESPIDTCADVWGMSYEREIK